MKKTSKNYSDIRAAGQKKIEERTALNTRSNLTARRTQDTENEKAIEAKMKGEDTMKNTATNSAAVTTAADAKTEPKTAHAMPKGTIEGSAQNEKYMWLNNAVLQINPAIQRKISPMRVDAIVRHFSPMWRTRSRSPSAMGSSTSSMECTPERRSAF